MKSRVANLKIIFNLIFFLTLVNQILALRNTQAESEIESVKKILKDDYPRFVEELGENIKDPKFRAAIRSLVSKERVKSQNLVVKVSKLFPTQNEIDVDKSLKFPLTSVDSVKSYLYCNEPIRILGKPIVTSANGKYVIDGHHRWSSIFSINPKCEMAAIDLKDIKDPINALKSAQIAIAAGRDDKGNEITTIPFAKVEGKNLLKISKQDLFAYVEKMIKSDVLDTFKAFNKKLDTASKVAAYIWKNVETMQKDKKPIEGAPGRGIMPQTDNSVNWVDNTVNIDKISSGFLKNDRKENKGENGSDDEDWSKLSPII